MANEFVTGLNVVPILKSELSWLQKHERLILGVLALAIILILGNLYIGHSADVATAKLAQAEATLKLVLENSNKLTQAAQQANQQYQQMVATLEAQNEKLTAANIAIASATKKQQATDKTLAPNELAARWQAVTPGVNPGDILPTTDGKFSVSGPGAVSTVVQLEQVPDLITELNNSSVMLQNKDKELGAASADITALRNQNGGLYQIIDANDKVCKAQVKDLKAQQRRSKRNWFLRGLGTGAGIAGAIAIHFM